MLIQIDSEFYEICEAIANKKLTAKQWAEIESSEMFQTLHYSGGFEEIENAFCFSYFDPSGKEYWFQVTLEEIQNIIENKKESIKLRPAS